MAELLDPLLPYRAIMHSAPVGIGITEMDGTFREVNPALCRATGWTAEEMVGRRVTDFLATPEQQVVSTALRRLVEEGLPSVVIEEPFRRADGGTVDLEVTVALLRDERGRPIGRIGYAQDLTATRTAKLAATRAMADLADAESFAHVGSFSYHPGTRTLIWSDELRRIFGLEASEPVSMDRVFERVHPEDRSHVVATIGRAEARQDSFTLQHRVLHPTLGLRWVRVRAEPELDASGAIIGMSGIVLDVTRQVVDDEARRDAEERFRRAFEDAPVGMAIMDPRGRFVQANDALLAMTGYTRAQLTSMSIAELSHPDHHDEGLGKGRQLLGGEVPSYEIQARLLASDGDVVWVDCNVSLARDARGAPRHLIAHVVDVTDRRKQAPELEHLATHDPLTGLLNRRAFEAELDQHAAESARYGAAGALLVLDIDHFKYVNDSHGHSVGDALIARVAAALRGRVRSSDVLARLGGDEFAVLLPRADEAEARTVGEALRQAVRTANVAAGTAADSESLSMSWAHRVTTSLGVALFESFRGHGAADVLAAADLAMYAAKEAGRDRLVVHHPSDRDQQRMQARVRWLNRIRNAVEHERLALWAQPIHDLATGAANRYELLLRMIGEDGEVVAPDDFLGVAERFGMMPEIDRWVAVQAITLLQKQHAAGNDVTVEVNVSGRSMGDADLLAAVERELARQPVPAGRLVFEVTETAAVADMEEAQRFAARLSELGCSFALDDFGAGFGSFYYAKHLPFDYLKIDGEFVRNCRTSRVDQVVIDSVVELARGLGKRTVAEFVQDEESVQLLRASGVDFGQGYYLGRPRPVADALPTSA